MLPMWYGDITDGLSILISQWQAAALVAGLGMAVRSLGVDLTEWLHGEVLDFDKERNQIVLDPAMIIARIHEIAGQPRSPKNS